MASQRREEASEGDAKERGEDDAVRRSAAHATFPDSK
jgi:hypothetical protein